MSQQIGLPSTRLPRQHLGATRQPRQAARGETRASGSETAGGGDGAVAAGGARFSLPRPLFPTQAGSSHGRAASCIIQGCPNRSTGGFSRVRQTPISVSAICDLSWRPRLHGADQGEPSYLHAAGCRLYAARAEPSCLVIHCTLLWLKTNSSCAFSMVHALAKK